MRQRSWLARGLAVLGALVSGAGVHAQLTPGPLGEAARELVTVRLLADAQRVGPGQTFDLAVVFDVAPQWHIYWKNPGEGALPPRIAIEGPEGFTIGPLGWPRPIAIETPLGREYCYADQAVLFVPVTAPKRLADGRATFHAKIDWAVCRNVCKLGSTRRSVDIETTGDPCSGTPGDDRLIRAHRKRLPKSLDDVAEASVSFDGSVLAIAGPAGGFTQAMFFPGGSPGVTFGQARIAIRDDRFIVDVEVMLDPANALGKPMAIEGLVALGDAIDEPCYDFRLPAPVR